MELVNALNIATMGMKAQSDRLRVVAENLANVDSVGEKPGDLPYRRKVVSFENVLDKELGVPLVRVSKYGTDKREFNKKYDPGHPAADKDGYVLYPNVNTMIESMDMREANKTYEANIAMVDVSKSMISQTLSIISK